MTASYLNKNQKLDSGYEAYIAQAMRSFNWKLIAWDSRISSQCASSVLN